MDAADPYVIRYATMDDVPVLRRLVEQNGRRLFCGPALVGEIDGVTAAAVSLTDGSVIADPSQPTTALRRLLRVRRDALRAHSDTPSLPERPRAPRETSPGPRAAEG